MPALFYVLGVDALINSVRMIFLSAGMEGKLQPAAFCVQRKPRTNCTL